MSMPSRMTAASLCNRHGHTLSDDERPHYTAMGAPADRLAGVQRHQPYDPPMPGSDVLSLASGNGGATPRPRKQTIKFGSKNIVHSYSVPGVKEGGSVS